MYITLQKYLTTSSGNEDIVTTLKALSECDNTNRPFVISSIEFWAETNTDIKINNASSWSNLREDQTDGLFKIDVYNQKINSFVVKDTGTVYYVKIEY